MSDTPETDEQFKSFPAYFEIDLFCRKLERERDEAREQITQINEMIMQSGEAVGNGTDEFSLIKMVQNLIRSKNYFVKRNNALECERNEARDASRRWLSELNLLLDKK